MGKLVTGEEADAIMKFWQVLLVGSSIWVALAMTLGVLPLRTLLAWQIWIFPGTIVAAGILKKRRPALVYIPFVNFFLWLLPSELFR